jgi:hypothetical protein
MMVCDLCKREGRSGRIETVAVECRSVPDGEAWSDLELQLQICGDCEPVFVSKLSAFVRSLGGGETFDELKGPEAPSE